MIDALRLTVLAYAVGLGLLFAFHAVTGRERSPTLHAGVIVLEVGVILQAVADLVSVAGGYDGDELAVHLAYVFTALVILPVTWSGLRLDQGRWASAVLSIACLVLAMVCLRMTQTLGPA